MEWTNVIRFDFKDWIIGVVENEMYFSEKRYFSVKSINISVQQKLKQSFDLNVICCKANSFYSNHYFHKRCPEFENLLQKENIDKEALE